MSPAVSRCRPWRRPGRRTARFAYGNSEAVAIGTTAVKCPRVAACNGVVTAVPAAAAINTAIGETGVHVLDDDSFSATVRCHDASAELFNVAVTRTAVTVSGYKADAILATVENWADAVPTLAQGARHCLLIRTAPAGPERPAGSAGPVDWGPTAPCTE